MAEPATYPMATMAKLLDLSPRRIRQLVDEGVFPRHERGRYALVPVVRGYIHYLRERAVNADVGPDELGKHRARKLKAEADQLEMRSGEMRGELIAASEFHQMVTSAFTRVRSKMLALPSKLAPVVAIEKTAAEVEKVLRDAVHEALAELATTRIIDGEPVDGDIEADITTGNAHSPAT